ncbi:hypothetical protein JOC93_002760 [Priestia taiwanensis]|nr:hypothetical protein [Priestia taiwanensis]
MKHMEDIYNQVDYLEEKYPYFIPQQQTKYLHM